MNGNNIDFLNRELQGKIRRKTSLIVNYKIQYPQLLSVSFPERYVKINAYYEEKATRFRNYCETELYRRAVSHNEYAKSIKSSMPKYQGVLTYTSTYNKNCTLSLYFDQYTFEGGAHGSTLRTSDTWDLVSGNGYPLNHFFQLGFDYKTYIIKDIDEQIKTQIQEGSDVYFNDYETLVHDRFNPENFYITDNGITIYYQEYELGPYSSGIIEFLIPYKENVVMEPVCEAALL